MKNRIFSILTLLLLALAAPLTSQVLPFEILGLKEGIPQSQATALAEDREGYLWVGTWGGLARRDTKGRWRNWDRTPGGEPLTSVALVTRHQRGGVWLVAKSRFFFCDGETLTPLNEPCPLAASVALSSIHEDSRGEIWIGTINGPQIFFMPSIALNLYLHKRFVSGILLYESTILASSRFLMRQCEGYLSLIFKLKNQKLKREAKN